MPLKTFKDLNREIFDQANKSDYLKRYQKGLSKELVTQISKSKGEPEWMLKLRLKSLDLLTLIPTNQKDD